MTSDEIAAIDRRLSELSAIILWADATGRSDVERAFAESHRPRWVSEQARLRDRKMALKELLCA